MEKHNFHKLFLLQSHEPAQHSSYKSDFEGEDVTQKVLGTVHRHMVLLYGPLLCLSCLSLIGIPK